MGSCNVGPSGMTQLVRDVDGHLHRAPKPGVVGHRQLSVLMPDLSLNQWKTFVPSFTDN